ncbi:MAG: M6 family metalloprotease domain-containing protein [Prevotella sp.]|nr:M6 family metalloprotease domain-containing protein [Prevotella sp.]
MKRQHVLQATRCLFAVLLTSLIAVGAFAVPAKPRVCKSLNLSNGQVVNATLVGDEYGHYWLGDDGKAYQLQTGTMVYHEVDARRLGQRSHVRRSAQNSRRSQRLAQKRSSATSSYTGEKKGLIILANFSDVQFTGDDPKGEIQLFINYENLKRITFGLFEGSLHDYFKDQSDEKLSLTFDIVGPVTLSNTQSYYGGNDSEGDDLRPREMVKEAVQLADENVDFANYDWDNDGEVDQVYVLYAGKGEADGGGENTIWPHEWNLGSLALTLDGKTIYTYACSAELDADGKRAGIGTMCHEFSHCLGFPDFYDTDNSGGQGMGYWDLMDSGSYNGDGHRPAGYTSYERWAAGWREPVELEVSTAVSGMKALTEGGESYIIYNSGNKNEYLLLENRQQTGWDKSLPGAGLLAIHVDYDATIWNDNKPNDDPSHQRMTWIPADGEYEYTTDSNGNKYYTVQGMATDPFPSGEYNAFGKGTDRTVALYHTNATGTEDLEYTVKDITQDADEGTISFSFVGTWHVATPTFSPESGYYEEAQNVAISCSTANAVIYYTTDGSVPTTSSTLYTGPLTVKETTLIKAIAAVGEDLSRVASATYSIGAEKYALVKDASKLAAGDKVLIAYVNGNTAYAMGGQNANNRAAVSITKNGDGTLTLTDNVEVVTLSKSGDSFMFGVTGGYLYAASSEANYLLTEQTADDNAKASVAINSNNGQATITFQGSNTRNRMRYNPNSGSPLFSCYKSSSTVGSAPMIYKLVGKVTLEDAADNSTAITDNSGETKNVIINGRTLFKDGCWNTLCLPFAVTDGDNSDGLTFTGTPLEGATVMQLDASSSSLTTDGLLTIVFSSATSIKAGNPYIVKWDKPDGYDNSPASFDITNPVFQAVTISSSSPQAVAFSNEQGDDCQFVGQYSPFSIDDDNKDLIVLLTSNDKLGYSKVARTLRAFRAHFLIPTTTSGQGARSFSISFEDEDSTTGMMSLTPYPSRSTEGGGYFDLQGRPVEKPGRGLYIMKGKVIVK